MSHPDRILLVRHGATEWSAQGRHTGRTDPSLTEVGLEQTRQLRPLLYRLIDTRHRADPPQPPVVFASPLRRAVETATIALPEAEVVEAHQLAEMDYGNFEGLTSAQIHELDPSWDFVDGSPGGESIAAVAARCESFIAKLERMAAGRTVVAFTHGHLSRVLTARLLGLPPTAASAFYNDTATIGVVDQRRGQLVLTGWNIAGS